MLTLSKIIIGSLALAFLGGCAVTTASFPAAVPGKGDVVVARKTHFSALQLFPLENADNLIERLADQCEKGKVEGITVTQVDRYFLGVYHDWKASGTCVR